MNSRCAVWDTIVREVLEDWHVGLSVDGITRKSTKDTDLYIFSGSGIELLAIVPGRGALAFIKSAVNLTRTSTSLCFYKLHRYIAAAMAEKATVIISNWPTGNYIIPLAVTDRASHVICETANSLTSKLALLLSTTSALEGSEIAAPG